MSAPRFETLPRLTHSLADKLSLAGIKPQDMRCPQCGHAWIGTSAVCPQCHGVAKSDGEVTKKTFQGEDDLRKGLR